MEYVRREFYDIEIYGVQQRAKYCGFIDESEGIRCHRFLIGDKIWKTYEITVAVNLLDHFLNICNMKVVG